MGTEIRAVVYHQMGRGKWYARGRGDNKRISVEAVRYWRDLYAQKGFYSVDAVVVPDVGDGSPGLYQFVSPGKRVRYGEHATSEFRKAYVRGGPWVTGKHLHKAPQSLKKTWEVHPYKQAREWLEACYGVTSPLELEPWQGGIPNGPDVMSIEIAPDAKGNTTYAAKFVVAFWAQVLPENMFAPRPPLLPHAAIDPFRRCSAKTGAPWDPDTHTINAVIKESLCVGDEETTAPHLMTELY